MIEEWSKGWGRGDELGVKQEQWYDDGPKAILCDPATQRVAVAFHW